MNPIIGTIGAAVVTGVLSLAGVIVTNASSNRTMESKLVTAQAVTDTKIDALREEVKKHNNFASRIPVLETEVSNLKRDVESIRNEMHK